MPTHAPGHGVGLFLELYTMIFSCLAREGDKDTLNTLRFCSHTICDLATEQRFGDPFVIEFRVVLLLLPVEQETDTKTSMRNLTRKTPEDEQISEDCRKRIRTLVHKIAKLHFPGKKEFEVAPGILECFSEISRIEDGTGPLFGKLQEIVAKPWPHDASSLLSALTLSRVPLRYISRQGAADSKRNPISLKDNENRWPSLWSESLQELEIYDPTQNEVEATAHLSSLQKLAIVGTEDSSLADSFSGLKGSSELFALTRMEVCCHSGGPAISFLSLVPLNCPDFRSLEITIRGENTDTDTAIIIESLAERLGSSAQPSLQELYVMIDAPGHIKGISMEGLSPLAKFKGLHKLCICTQDVFVINNSAFLQLTSQFKVLEELSLHFPLTSADFQITSDVLPDLIDNLGRLEILELGLNVDAILINSERLPIRAVDASRCISLTINPVTSSDLSDKDKERIATFLRHLLPGEEHHFKLLNGQ